MKKFLFFSVLLLLVLAGCQNSKNGELDTSKLTKVDMEDVTEEQKKKIPITYEAPSVEVGLEALPFEMKLPEKLPFDALPFQPPIINDFTHDGKHLMVEFRTFSKNKEEKIILMITADYPSEKREEPNFEEVTLDNGVIGEYRNNTLVFQLDDVSYSVAYVNKNIPVEQHQKEIVEMANQMLNK